MIEKVNLYHPDKIADRIAGAIVDLAYHYYDNPKVACEVLIGHGYCHIILETDVDFEMREITDIVYRIAGDINCDIKIQNQDEHLAANQVGEIKCGDNGIFKGVPLTHEQILLSNIAHEITDLINSDGKYILNDKELIICQSNIKSDILRLTYPDAIINPLGEWSGGTTVDTGATNRKLGSDMADSITGGGIHGKDLSKADVSINIYCFIEAQKRNCIVTACCAIGDTDITINYDKGHKETIPYKDIVEVAKNYIDKLGGFEKLAEWGLY